MSRRGSSFIVIIFLICFLANFCHHADSIDPYKVLGVDKKASQRDIQKAFHKLSLQYHPDKNKARSAQAKFAEINNAYEILSDEEKRKNYDLYGDEKGGPNFAGANYGGPHPGSAHFTYGNQGGSGFNFGQDQWYTTGTDRNSEPFQFTFPQGGSSSFSFGFGGSNFGGDFFSDLLSNFRGKNQFSGFGNSNGKKSGSQTSQDIQSISGSFFEKEVSDQGLTWLLLFYVPGARSMQAIESIVREVAGSLKGAMKAGSINCQSEQALCKKLGVYPTKRPRVYIYSYRKAEEIALIEYEDDVEAKELKKFCLEQLPRLSKRVDLSKSEFSSRKGNALPQVILLTTKKETPMIWRILSGLYRKRIAFYDSEVHAISNPVVKKLKVDKLPAIVGILPTGEKQILSSGVVVKDVKSATEEIGKLLEKFEVQYRKAEGQKKKESASEPANEDVPLLTKTSLRDLCGEKITVCIIGVFRKQKTKEKLSSILSTVSQKKMTRHQSSSHDTVSYSLLDASKQSSFLNSFDKSGFKSSDGTLVAYKPRRERFAVYWGDTNLDKIEDFVSLVLSGDVQFKKVLRDAELK